MVLKNVSMRPQKITPNHSSNDKVAVTLAPAGTSSPAPTACTLIEPASVEERFVQGLPAMHNY